MSALINRIKANKGISWGIFWIGWFMLSPTTIIPGSIAFGVGYVFHKERAVSLVAVCAAWVGFVAYLGLAGALAGLPGEVGIWIGLSLIFSLVILGKRFPMFGLFWICLISGLINGRAGYYYPLWWRRRW